MLAVAVREVWPAASTRGGGGSGSRRGVWSPWLPAWPPFLPGLPKPRRRRRLLVPVQAFLDDSGCKGQGHVFVLAGLIAPAEQWAEFSIEWGECLASPPAIRVFKLTEAMSCTGNFHRFSYRDRERKVAALARIIVRHATTAFTCTLDLGAFERTFTQAQRPFNGWYFAAYFYALFGLCVDIYGRGYAKEEFEAIFDEQRIFEPRIKEWYPRMKSLARIVLVPEASILPSDLLFRSDDAFQPLQAADMLAGLFRHAGNRLLGGLGPSKEPLLETIDYELMALPISPESVALSSRRLERVWNANQAVEEAIAGEPNVEWKADMIATASIISMITEELKRS